MVSGRIKLDTSERSLDYVKPGVGVGVGVVAERAIERAPHPRLRMLSAVGPFLELTTRVVVSRASSPRAALTEFVRLLLPDVDLETIHQA